MNLGLVVAQFNEDLTSSMEQSAITCANSMGANITKILHVPGVFDCPLAVKKLLIIDSIDAIVVLGAVIKGETKHDELITNAIATCLIDLSLKYDKPVTLGISGPGITHSQAEARIEKYPKRAVAAAIKLANELK